MKTRFKDKNKDYIYVVDIVSVEEYPEFLGGEPPEELYKREIYTKN